MKRLPESEAGFQAAVIDLAHRLGWRVAHFPRVKTSRGVHLTVVAADAAGYPDLTLARNGRVVWAELKTDRGRTTPRQDAWALEIRGRDDTNECYVWRPKDWDEITRTLGGAT